MTHILTTVPSTGSVDVISCNALDPRCKMLYGVLPNEHEAVRQAVTMAAADIAKSTQASVGATVLSAAGSTPAAGSIPSRPEPEASARPASKRFCGGFMAASQAQAASASTATAAPSLPTEHFLKEAEREVTRYWATRGLAMEEAQESGKILYPDPLDCRRINAVKFPLLAALARRLLAIPASRSRSACSRALGRLSPRHATACHRKTSSFWWR